jgi:hypothetical protein
MMIETLKLQQQQQQKRSILCRSRSEVHRSRIAALNYAQTLNEELDVYGT